MSKSSKLKKLSPRIYKVKQSNMLYSVNNPMVFREETIPKSSIGSPIQNYSPRRSRPTCKKEETTEEVILSSLNLNEPPRNKAGRASTVEGAAEKPDFLPPNPFRPVLIPKLKRPITI
jgi:hypothetical protein